MKKILFIDDVMRPGFGSAISTKPLVDSYIQRYNNKLQNDIKGYCVRNKEDFVFHILIPSEKNEEYDKKIYYDVILQFYPVDKNNKTDLTIRNYGLKVFCNSPSWMFGFTYIFAKTDNIPSFVPKKYYSKAALIEPPKQKNPYKLFGIDRVVFSALYYLEINLGFRKNRIELITNNSVNLNSLLTKIMSQEEKKEQVDLENKKLTIKKSKGKSKSKKTDLKSETKRKASEGNRIYNSLKDNKLKFDTKSSKLSDSGLKSSKTNKLKSKLSKK